jgi:hypothetical protein
VVRHRARQQEVDLGPLRGFDQTVRERVVGLIVRPQQELTLLAPSRDQVELTGEHWPGRHPCRPIKISANVPRHNLVRLRCCPAEFRPGLSGLSEIRTNTGQPTATTLPSMNPGRVVRKLPPASAECAWSTPLFAEAEALVSGMKHDFSDLVPFAARALPGNGAVFLALAIAKHGARGALDVLHGASAALDADLEGPDGKLRVHSVGKLQWRRVRAADQTAVELRVRVQGPGGRSMQCHGRCRSICWGHGISSMSCVGARSSSTTPTVPK